MDPHYPKTKRRKIISLRLTSKAESRRRAIQGLLDRLSLQVQNLISSNKFDCKMPLLKPYHKILSERKRSYLKCRSNKKRYSKSLNRSKSNNTLPPVVGHQTQATCYIGSVTKRELNIERRRVAISDGSLFERGDSNQIEEADGLRKAVDSIGKTHRIGSLTINKPQGKESLVGFDLPGSFAISRSPMIKHIPIQKSKISQVVIKRGKYSKIVSQSRIKNLRAHLHSGYVLFPKQSIRQELRYSLHAELPSTN